MRATIKAYQRDYVRQIGELLGTSDPTEIVSRIIADHQLRLAGASATEIQNAQSQAKNTANQADESLLGLLA